MSHRDAPAICRKIDVALEFLGEDEELRPYVIHQIGEILGGRKRISMEECATSELMSMLAVLLPIFARHLAGLGIPETLPLEGGKILRLIVGDVGDDTPTGTD
jgi:hypothetical protein